jgi:hypothetical protein
MQPDLTILKAAPKREMKILGFLNGKIHGEKQVFSSHV